MKVSDSFLKQLEELDKLDFLTDDYAITSSGPLAVRGIREAKDIDIVVTDSLWRKLKKKYSVEEKEVCDIIKIGEIDILGNFKFNDPKYTSENQVQNADIFLGKRFVNLETVVYFKKKLGRDKDLKDIELITQYLKDN